MKNFINQQDMKQMNAADIFALIKKCGALTRKQIAEMLDISWGAVSTITSLLISEGYIEEKKATSDGVAGRIPSYLEVCRSKHFAIGLDVNDMGLRAVVVDLCGDVVEEHSSEADFSGGEALVGCVYSLLDSIIAAMGERHLLCIGIAMQGVVNSESGVSLKIPGRDNWESIPLAHLIEERYGVPAYLEHDPNCILFAARRGKIKDTLLVRVDQGIGMAVMLDGKILDKPGIFELGHTVVAPHGEPCTCGKRGCLDQYASIRGIRERSGKKFSALVSCARLGDEEALEHLFTAAQYLAYAISNAAYLLSVERVVLCGRFFEHRELFWDEFTNNYQIFGGFDIPKFSFADATAAPHGAALIALGATLKKISI